MVYCYAFGCNHTSVRSKCHYFRFPSNLRKWKQWETLCRRSDRVANNNDRLCGCHFKDGLKENGPTIFSFSKPVDFPEPEVKKRKVVEEKDAMPQHSQDTTMDHPYTHPCPKTCSTDKEAMIEKISNLEEKIVDLQAQIVQMSQRKPKMKIKHIMKNNKKMMLYTSLPYELFEILLEMIKRKEPISYIRGWSVTSIPLSDQLLMTLMKLRLNLRDLDLSERFGIGRTTISNIVQTLVRVLHELLHTDVKLVVSIPSQLKHEGSMPVSTADVTFAQVTLDDTEMTQDVPSRSSTRSSRRTAKTVVHAAPRDPDPSSTSDNATVNCCELLDQFVPGDNGFTMSQDFPEGVSVNIIPFLMGKSHISKQEAELCQKIARSRVHVGRANERMKLFEILHRIPSNYRSVSTKIFQVCSFLASLQQPLLKEIADKCKSD